jgi:N-acyl homoserine lactone hydrolase
MTRPLRVHRITAGEVFVDEGRLFTPGINEGSIVRAPIPVLLVETGTELILIDTGISPVHMEDSQYSVRGRPISQIAEPRLDPEQWLPNQIKGLGLRLDDITGVLNTHLHWDHAGNNTLFEGVAIYVQRAHFEYAVNADHLYPENWNKPQLTYELLDGDDEVVPGIEVIVAEGHVPGFQAVLVDLVESRPILFAGDAINCENNLRFNTFSDQYNHNAKAAKRSANRLREIASDRNALMIFGHDARQWEHLPKEFK